MFDKLKTIKQLKSLQNSLSQYKEEIRDEGVKVVINGNMEIEDISLNSDLDQKKQEEVLKNCLNKAIKRIKINLGQKASEIFKLRF